MTQTIQSVTLPLEPSPTATYHLIPNPERESCWEQRVDRNVGWITEDEQQRLRETTIGVAGCGGMGAQLIEKFLRLGVGTLKATDNEVFDWSNVNRQFAAGRTTIGASKAFATGQMLREIADDFHLWIYPQGICEDTVESFVHGCDLIADEIEFWAAGSRILLHQVARAHGVPVFNCNTVGFGSHLHLFTPASASIEELLGMTYKTAASFQQKVQNQTAAPGEVRKLMNAVLTALVPIFPSYEQGDRDRVRTLTRLEKTTTASIIATNPPFATGFLADWILVYLSGLWGNPRTGWPLPEAPDYLYLDAVTSGARNSR